MKYKDTVYLIDEDYLRDNNAFRPGRLTYTRYMEDAVFDVYNAATFPQEFGAMSDGLIECLLDFQQDISGATEYDARSFLSDRLWAVFPDDGEDIYPLYQLFTTQFEDWYDDLEMYDFFDSSMIETICAVARDGAIFADEVVPPIRDEVILEALDVMGLLELEE